MTSDPIRLLSQDEDDTFATSLLKSARDGDSAAARRRKAAVLGAAGGAAAGSAALAVTKLAPKGIWAVLGGKWLAAGVLLTVGGVGGGAALLWSRAGSSETSLASGAPGVAAQVAPSHEAAPAASAQPADPPAMAAAAPAPEEPSAAPAGSAASAAEDAPTRPRSAAAQPRSAAPADAAAAPSAAPASGAATARPTTPGTAAEPATAATAPASTSEAASELSQEVAALRSAREALGRGESAKCIAAVDAYFARFPSGHLSAEARVLRIEAMFMGGQRAQAAALASSMLAQNPRSPYAARLRTIAGQDAPAGAP